MLLIHVSIEIFLNQKYSYWLLKSRKDAGRSWKLPSTSSGPLSTVRKVSQRGPTQIYPDGSGIKSPTFWSQAQPFLGHGCFLYIFLSLLLTLMKKR